eukprot:GEMP01005166.1.p1 GENE.GEMP01005166.1~~GEMP01005166.1.p1  ORF type:complete len:910 (+),score=202.50 GEMP01005166.1:308-3037(+)
MYFFARNANVVLTTRPLRDVFGPLQFRHIRISTKTNLVTHPTIGRKSANKRRILLHKPPPTLYALPLYRRPAFPGFYQVIQVRDQALIEKLQQLRIKTNRDTLAGFLTKETYKEESSASTALRIDAGPHYEQLEEVGTVLQIISLKVHDNHTGAQLVVLPRTRVRRTECMTEGKPLPQILYEELLVDEREVDELGKHTLAKHHAIMGKMKDLIKTSYIYREHYDQVIRYYNTDMPGKLSDLVCGMSMAKREDLQLALEEIDLDAKLDKTLVILEHDLAFSKIQTNVKLQVEQRMNKEQRKYIMMEQLKHLKRELGLEKDDKTVLIQNFRNAIDGKPNVPADILEIVEHEIQKLSMLEAASSEFNVSRTYLEWLTSMPWGTLTEDNTNIAEAQRMLEEDHHGLDDVKDRILEFMAVSFLRKSVMPGKIMCMVGPPGVGKTSLGKSIARALGRKFYRFSVGGLTDVAEIRGHRRTYIGSMPGKLVQCLRNVQSMNPVVLIDEIDKIGKDFRGDPASALLEVLDPEQNNQFRDYYLDVPVDLSQVLFVCTANTTDSIPAPLLDRMEVIRLAGYVFEEKMSIAKDYLIPQTLESTGLQKEAAYVSEPVLSHLIQDYAREAGVRSLQRYIEKIHRKIALRIVRDENAIIELDLSSLHDFVGQPVYQSERMYDVTPPGVVMGLAWTSMGGATLYVEATALTVHGSERQKGTLKVTGQLGNVMSESTQIAHSYAKKMERELYANADDNAPFSAVEQCYPLEDWNIHLHVPEGATPKDGPSAGITLCTSLLSMSLNLPVPKDLAMTGELSLTGKVLRIGGLKEKTIAAKRENANILIFPKSNERDFVELKDYLKTNITTHFVENFEDVIRIVWPELAPYLRKQSEISLLRAPATKEPASVSTPQSNGPTTSTPAPST